MAIFFTNIGVIAYIAQQVVGTNLAIYMFLVGLLDFKLQISPILVFVQRVVTPASTFEMSISDLACTIFKAYK